MEIGIALPNLGSMARPEAIDTLLAAAEPYAFAHLWLGDHVAIPAGGTRASYPHGSFGLTGAHPILEPLATLGYVAARTTRPRIGLSVLIVPYRQPVLAARMLFTLDALSRGRLICGVGSGWLREEFEVLGADFARRNEVTDESLQLLRRLAVEDDVTFEGRLVRCEHVTLEPKPVQRPCFPIWVGGNGRRAMRRAAMWADGWQPTAVAPREVHEMCEQLAVELEATGRPRERVVVSARISCGAEPSGPADGPGLWGTAPEMVETAHAYAAAGADALVLTLRAASLEGAAELVAMLGSEVVSQLAAGG